MQQPFLNIHHLTCQLFLLLGMVAMGQHTIAQVPDDSPWHLTATDLKATNSDSVQYFGVTVGNGMIGMVSDASPLRMSEVVLNGAFDTYGRGRVSNILKTFNPSEVRIEIDGEVVGPGNATDFSQVLNMKTGMLVNNFTLPGKAEITYAATAVRHLPFTSMIEVTITPLKDISLYGIHALETPEILRDPQQTYSSVVSIHPPYVAVPLMTTTATSPTGKHILSTSCSYLFSGNGPDLTHEERDYNKHSVSFRQKLNKGKPFSFVVLSSSTSTAHYTDPKNEAERLTVYAALEGVERLKKRHEAAWMELWRSDIQIEGDLRSQLAVRSALYHLYAFCRAGTSYSPSPMGLSGLGYNGHVFWDTEIWMYPPMLMLQPELALSMLKYRKERLGVAKQNAMAHGYKGAMFPWESDDVGQEATPVWALTGPFEHHITGTVGVAHWNYYRLTKDKVWLASHGYPVMKEVADFWVSRVEKDEAGNCHIYNVVAADEYAENIDDNAFTNGVAIEALQHATKAAGELGITPDPSWKEMADCIPILKLPDGTTREHATYQDTIIKQADVNLLAYPLSIVTDEKSIRKDLEFYEPRMSETGPAMSHAVLSILYSRLGEPEKAFELFQKAYQPNEVPPFGVLAECPGCTNPYFATGAGGLLQAVINGFGGLDLTDEGIIQHKIKLPKAWKSLKITGVGADERTFEVK
ncbi:MAG: glycoside hydrolase family 65 protein [Bacteroidota bacterium]